MHFIHKKVSYNILQLTPWSWNLPYNLMSSLYYIIFNISKKPINQMATILLDMKPVPSVSSSSLSSAYIPTAKFIAREYPTDPRIITLIWDQGIRYLPWKYKIWGVWTCGTCHSHKNWRKWPITSTTSMITMEPRTYELHKCPVN